MIIEGLIFILIFVFVVSIIRLYINEKSKLKDSEKEFKRIMCENRKILDDLINENKTKNT